MPLASPSLPGDNDVDLAFCQSLVAMELWTMDYGLSFDGMVGVSLIGAGGLRDYL